jgi:L-amino acid N-acyltransferase YncA
VTLAARTVIERTSQLQSVLVGMGSGKTVVEALCHQPNRQLQRTVVGRVSSQAQRRVAAELRRWA